MCKAPGACMAPELDERQECDSPAKNTAPVISAGGEAGTYTSLCVHRYRVPQASSCKGFWASVAETPE